MEMAGPDHVVLSVDQQNANNPSMQTELNREPNKILPLEKNSLSFSAPDLHQIPATRKQTPHRLSFSKPKSRLLELKYPLTAHSKTIPESNEIEPFLDDNDNSNIYSTHVDDNEWDKELEDDSEDEDVGTESKQRKEIGSPIGDFLRNCIRNCMWLGLVLRAWTCIFNEKLHKKNKMLEKVFRALVAVSLGATIWLIKIVLVKVLASSFHVTTYFNRMKESVFHHYILETLSGPPKMEGLMANDEEKKH
ncbi:hypothetical protein WN943_006931 [Citrus x changshan-huyou]